MFFRKVMKMPILIIILSAISAYCLDIDSLKSMLGPKLTPEASAEVIRKEREKTLELLRETIQNGFKELEKFNTTKEMFLYMLGEKEGTRVFNEVKSIKSKYKRIINHSFSDTYNYLIAADITLMGAIGCARSYSTITKWLLSNSVPKVTGEQLKAYNAGNYSDTLASLYVMFKRHLGLDTTCEAYSVIIGKILQDRNLNFIYKYSNLNRNTTDTRLFYYLENLSIDSLSAVIKEIFSFDKRETSILIKWDEERSLVYLYNNTAELIQKAQSLERSDTLSFDESKTFQEIISFLKEKNTLKMFDYWDIKFAEKKHKTIYPDLKNYVKKLHQKE